MSVKKSLQFSTRSIEFWFTSAFPGSWLFLSWFDPLDFYCWEKYIEGSILSWGFNDACFCINEVTQTVGMLCCDEHTVHNITYIHKYINVFVCLKSLKLEMMVPHFSLFLFIEHLYNRTSTATSSMNEELNIKPAWNGVNYEIINIVVCGMQMK